MDAEAQRVHAVERLRANREAFSSGPRWTFSVDTMTTPYVAFVEVDLANEHWAPGVANVSYSCHPEHRGNGYSARAVRLALRFLRDHTAAREARLLVEDHNTASHRVAFAAGAAADGSTTLEGRPAVRYRLAVRDEPNRAATGEPTPRRPAGGSR